MTEIGLGEAMNDSFINILNKEIFNLEDTAEGLGEAMNDSFINILNKEIFNLEDTVEGLMCRLNMGCSLADLRNRLFYKQFLEIEIEKRKMQLRIEKIKVEIVKLHDLLRKTTNVSESMPLVEENMKLISERMPLVEEKMKEIVWSYKKNNLYPDLNTELKSNTEKLNRLRGEIYLMELRIDKVKMTKMKIKYITVPDPDPDVVMLRNVLHFNDEESSENEQDTYKYNQQRITSASVMSSNRNFSRMIQEDEELKQLISKGLDYAKPNGRGLRSVDQYWHLPLSEDWKSLELPEKGGGDEVGKGPLTLQIYSLELTCCSDDQKEDYIGLVSGEISLQIHGSVSTTHVKSQTLSKRHPYLLLGDPTFIPPLKPSDPPPMMHANLLLRDSDGLEFVDLQATRSMEVVDEVYMSGGTSALSEDVNLGTGNHYVLKLTHGIVVNAVVANISVHLHPSLFDSWDGKCKITATEKCNPCQPVVLANSKKLQVTIDYDKCCLQLLRQRICVDFFGALFLDIKCLGSSSYLSFIPRDCDSHDNCERKEALDGIYVEVEWSTS